MVQRKAFKSCRPIGKHNQSWQFISAQSSLNTSRRILQKSILTDKRVDNLLSTNTQLAKRLSALQSELTQKTQELHLEKERSFQLNLQLNQIKSSSFRNTLFSLKETHEKLEAHILEERRLISLLLTERNCLNEMGGVNTLDTPRNSDIIMESFDSVNPCQSPMTVKNSSCQLSRSIDMSPDNLTPIKMTEVPDSKFPSNEDVLEFTKIPKKIPIASSCDINKNTSFDLIAGKTLKFGNACHVEIPELQKIPNSIESELSGDKLPFVEGITSSNIADTIDVKLARSSKKKESPHKFSSDASIRAVKSPEIRTSVSPLVVFTCKDEKSKGDSENFPIKQRRRLISDGDESPNECLSDVSIRAVKYPEITTVSPLVVVTSNDEKNTKDSDDFPRKQRRRLICRGESFSDDEEQGLKEQDHEMKRVRFVNSTESESDKETFIKSKSSGIHAIEKTKKGDKRNVNIRRRKLIVDDSVFINITNNFEISKDLDLDSKVDANEIENDVVLSPSLSAQHPRRNKIVNYALPPCNRKIRRGDDAWCKKAE